MTEDEALRLLAELIVCTNGWDEVRVRGWTMMLMDLHDVQAATRTVELVCKSWKSAAPVPWGQIMANYETQPRDLKALPSSTRPVVSFHAFLSSLKAKALTGDRDAIREFAQWKHYISTSNTWLSAIGDGIDPTSEAAS